MVVWLPVWHGNTPAFYCVRWYFDQSVLSVYCLKAFVTMRSGVRWVSEVKTTKAISHPSKSPVKEWLPKMALAKIPFRNVKMNLWIIYKQELGECIPPLIWTFLAPSNRKSMGQSVSLMIFCIQTMNWMKLKTESDLIYIDPLTVEFFQNNETSSISVILLTNGQKEGRTEGQTNGQEFNTFLAEVINK